MSEHGPEPAPPERQEERDEAIRRRPSFSSPTDEADTPEEVPEP